MISEDELSVYNDEGVTQLSNHDKITDNPTIIGKTSPMIPFFNILILLQRNQTQYNIIKNLAEPKFHMKSHR
jgi:hypothetical protein